jgi:hypothetical protein
MLKMKINNISEEENISRSVKLLRDSGYLVFKNAKDAKKSLKKLGYRIYGPIKVKTDVDSVSKLVNYFYHRLFNKYPDRKIGMPNFARDHSIAKNFVESRMIGVSEKVALQECVDIIDAIFDFEEAFDFQYSIKNLGILGQSKMSWVTEKAISIVNHQRELEEERFLEKWFEEFEDSFPVDRDAVNEELDRLLAEIEASNAEKNSNIKQVTE